jgi:hypothetical protein
LTRVSREPILREGHTLIFLCIIPKSEKNIIERNAVIAPLFMFTLISVSTTYRVWWGKREEMLFLQKKRPNKD